MTTIKLDLTKSPSQIFSKRLTRIKYSQLIIKDLENINLIKDKELKSVYLLQSYIINLIAAWQTFVEELLEYGLSEILKSNSNDHIHKLLKNNISDRLARFNTPNSENIDVLFKNVLGIEKITNLLDNASESKKKINEILVIRHQIAHRGYSTKELSIVENFSYMEHLFEVANALENIVKERLNNDSSKQNT